MSKFVFFFDRNISPRLAEMTKIYEGPRHIIQHHDTRFHEKTSDVEWLAALGNDTPRPIVISGDAAILKNKVERSVLKTANLSYFCLQRGWTAHPFADQVWMFFKVWPMIVSSADVSPPRLFDVRVGNNPKIEIGLPTGA